MNSQVVNATADDVESLIAIYSSPHLYHSREEAQWFVKSFFDYHHIKLIKLDKQVIGASFWKVVEEKHHGLTEIEDFWIDENHRRKGYGEKLLRSTIEDMKHFFTDNGFTLRKVLVTTGEDKEPARRLYEKIGFLKSAVLKDLFAQGENELVYILTTKP